MNATINNKLPVLSNEGGLSAYLEQIKKFPMLDAEEEYMLAKNWKTTGNIKAAEKLVTSFSAALILPVVFQFFASIYSSSAANIGNFLICSKYADSPPSLESVGRLLLIVVLIAVFI